MEKSLYEQAGVESDKGHIKEAFSDVIQSEYPYAFVNIKTDPWTPGWVMTKHPDGSGSRSTTHWLYYAETGDASFLPYDIADSIAMNGDIVAGGFVGHQILTDIIDINSNNVDKELIVSSVAKGINQTLELLGEFGFSLEEGERLIRQMDFLGGETADLVDQLTSYSLNVDVFSRMPRENIVAGNVQPGDTIFGFSSGGQAHWEDRPNSGHMSNGSTLSGPVLLSAKYQKKYPFLRTSKNAFRGPFEINHRVHDLRMTVGEALLAPTRQWAIVMKMIIEMAKNDECFDKLHAIIMNTGGGLTKCGHVGQGIRYVKQVPRFLPIFELIQAVSRENTLGMLKTFNCGVGLEVIGDNSDGKLEKIIRAISPNTNIPSFTLGHCIATRDPQGKNEVIVEYADRKFGPRWK